MKTDKNFTHSPDPGLLERGCGCLSHLKKTRAGAFKTLRVPQSLERRPGKGLVLLSLSLLLISACGNQVDLNRGSPATSPSPSLAVVLAASFQDPVGSLATVDNTTYEVSAALEQTHTDAIVTCQNHKIYVVNRWGADNIQVVDPKNFESEIQFSTGNGTNPQDIVVVSDTKAFVSLYQPDDNGSEELTIDDLIIVNPTTGEITGSLDLTPLTEDDGDRVPRASTMLADDHFIYVALQDLPSDFFKAPDAPSKLVIIDPNMNTIVDTIVLSGRNATYMSFGPQQDSIYISETSFFGLDNNFGGIERVNLKTRTTEGLILDDLLLEGTPGPIEVIADQGYVAVSSLDPTIGSKVYRFDLNTNAPEPVLIYEAGGFIQDLAKDPVNETLWIGDQGVDINGLMIYDPRVGEFVAGPISVGAPPSSLCFNTF